MDNLTYNADLLFIEYDDILRSPALAFLKGARSNGELRELFDFSQVDSLDDVGLTEWYWFRFNKNPLLDLNPTVPKEFADEILKVNLSHPDFYFLYTATQQLHLSSRIPSIIAHKIVKKIIVWSPYKNPNIERSLKDTFQNLPVYYLPGDFKKITQQFSKDATYMLSDIDHIAELHECGRLDRASIVLATYRYNMMKSNMHMLKMDFEQFMKDEKIVFKYAFWNPTRRYIDPVGS